jgi:hypothetical protein
MEYIKAEDLPPLLPLKKGRSTNLRIMLLTLKVGDGLFMAKEEWKTKTGPYFIVARIKKTHGFRYTYGMKPDGSGWLFCRIA